MRVNLTPQDLIDFENDIANCFNNKQIHAPIHLESNNAEKLIEVFKDINEEDWILCSWRSHLKCLLKGVPPDLLKKNILDGKSISLCFKDYNVLSSAIVGGSIPIGLGLALDIKLKNQKNKIWIFVGEMTSTIGVFHEAITYATNHSLPLTFVVEDNGKSVVTDTRKVWNTEKLYYEPDEINEIYKSKHLYYFKYHLTWPHAGSGTRIQF